jgi:uncharacterized membrane protein
MSTANRNDPAHAAYLASCALLIVLMLLCVAWELWLAPLRPGGTWLVLKVVPLMFVLFGVLRGNRRTFQALSLLVWLYVAEGLTRATSDRGFSATLGWVEAALATALFIAVAIYCRATRTPVNASHAA